MDSMLRFWTLLTLVCGCGLDRAPMPSGEPPVAVMEAGGAAGSVAPPSDFPPSNEAPKPEPEPEEEPAETLPPSEPAHEDPPPAEPEPEPAGNDMPQEADPMPPEPDPMQPAPEPMPPPPIELPEPPRRAEDGECPEGTACMDSGALGDFCVPAGAQGFDPMTTGECAGSCGAFEEAGVTWDQLCMRPNASYPLGETHCAVKCYQ